MSLETSLHSQGLRQDHPLMGSPAERSSRSTSLLRRIYACITPYLTTLNTLCQKITRSFCATPLRARAPSVYQTNPIIKELAAENLAKVAAQAARHDLKIRTESLLNSAIKIAGPHQEPEKAIERLRNLLNWKKATPTEYASLMGLIDTTKQLPLNEWEASYQTLHATALKEGSSQKQHAVDFYQTLQNLKTAPKGSTAHYAGAFGKKRFLLQNLFSTCDIHKHLNQELPESFKNALEQEAFSNPEALLSHGLDLLFNQLLDPSSNDLSPEIRNLIPFLKPFFPDIERHSSLWNSLKFKLPTWLARKGDESIQLGILSCFLELIPDHPLRDQCIEIIEEMAKGTGSHAENHRALLLAWKPFLLKKASEILPLEPLEEANSQLEELLANWLHKLPSCASPLVDMFNHTLSSYGTYWLEWDYHKNSDTYSLTIYGSGSALTASNYPRLEEQPVWPIRFSNISLDFSLDSRLPGLLEAMSQTTALTKGWHGASGNLKPATASILFGSEGLIALLKSQGAIDVSLQQDNLILLPPQTSVTEADKISYYLAPTSSPSLIRYNVLRQALLEAASPFAKSSFLGEPPHLFLPEGENGAKLLQLFESSVEDLKHLAEKENLSQETMQELSSFQQQLKLTGRANSQAAFHLEGYSNNQEATLGIFVDMFLKGFCQAEGIPHLFEEYRDLLIFALGAGSEGFVNILCARAKQLQKEVRPSKTPKAPDIALKPVEALYKSKSERTTFYALYTLLQVVRSIREVEGLLSCAGRVVTQGWTALLPDMIRLAAPHIIPQPIQDELSRVYNKLYSYFIGHLRDYAFSLLFPRLKNTNALHALHTAIFPYLSQLPGVELPRTLPILLESPPAIKLSFHGKTTLQAQVKVRHNWEEEDAQKAIQEPRSINIQSIPCYNAHGLCEEALASVLKKTVNGSTLSITDLPSLLVIWLNAAKEFPHLLMEQIYTLPILPGGPFTFSFDSENRQEEIETALKWLGKIGEQFHTDWFKKGTSLSKKHLQLAQYHLLALSDLLARQLHDHPFGNLPIDADALLEVLTTPWGDDRYIYMSSRPRAETLLRYFYPHFPSLNALILRPPTLQERKKWKEERWFCNIQESDNSIINAFNHVTKHKFLAKDSPELTYYKKMAEKTKNEPLFFKRPAYHNDLDPVSIIKSRTGCTATNDLIHIAHFPDYFIHPLHKAVPLLRLQMLRCHLRTLTIQYDAIDRFEWRLHTRQEELKPGFLREKIQTFQTYLLTDNYSHSLVKAIKAPEKPQFTEWGLTLIGESRAFWVQEYVATGMTPGQGAVFEEPLTAPARALRLIAYNPHSARQHLFNIQKMLLDVGHIEVDFEQNPALIQNYAEGMQALFDITQDFHERAEIFDLSLRLKNRTWHVNPPSQAFIFLDAILVELYKQANTPERQLRVMVLEALYRDHPHPETLSQEEQQCTLSLLFTLLIRLPEPIFCDLASKYLDSLEQMVMRWRAFLPETATKTLLFFVPPQSAHPLAPDKTMAQHWSNQAIRYKVKESIVEGGAAFSTSWLEVTPVKLTENEEGMLLHTQEAHIYRRVQDVKYTLLTHDGTRAQLFQTLSKPFHWLPPLQSIHAASTQLWLSGETADPVDGSKVSVLVTFEEESFLFVLEAIDGDYQLLGMLDPDSNQIVYPASKDQVHAWCASWGNFCPLTSMELLVERQNGNPVYCQMTPFDLDFTFTENSPGKWKAENTKRFPGFFISSQQNVPFGLVLEKLNGEKQLLLPSQNLLVQGLYAQIDPLFGILGNWIERQPLLHAKSSTLYTYNLIQTPYAKDRWNSKDPFAMVHLLLLHFASKNKEGIYQAGNALLNMPLPKNLAIELLPLHLSQDPQIKRLHANLLARMEASLLAPVPDAKKAGCIGEYIPKKERPILAWFDLYAIMLSETSLELPNETLHTLFHRYRGLLNDNKQQLISKHGLLNVFSALGTHVLALQLLPEAMQRRIESLEMAIGNQPSSLSRSISVARKWYAAPSPALFNHPLIKMALLSQSGITGMGGRLYDLAGKDWTTRTVRSLFCYESAPAIKLSAAQLLLLSQQVKEEIDMHLTPESLSAETLIPYFITYQAHALGKFGKAKQTRLINHLRNLHWNLQGLHKQLGQILLSLAAHPYRYSLFNAFSKRKLQKRLIEYNQYTEQKVDHSSSGVVISPEVPFEISTAYPYQKTQLLVEWDVLMQFSNIQPRWNATQSVSQSILCLFGSYYMLSKISETIFQSTVSVISPYVATSTSPEENSPVLQMSMLMTIAAMILYKPNLKSTCAVIQTSTPFKELVSLKKRLPSPLNAVNKLTGLNLSIRSVSNTANTMMTFIGLQCLMACANYSSSLNASPLNNSTLIVPSQEEEGSNFNPMTTLACAVTLLPTMRYLYNALHLYILAEEMSKNPIQKRKAIVLQQDPSFSMTCQEALHTENERWMSFLDTLFEKYFASYLIEKKPVVLNSIHSVKIQDSLTEYAKQTKNTKRFVFAPRSAESLKALSTEVETLLSDLETFQRNEFDSLLNALGIPQEEQGIAIEAFRHFFAVGSTNILDNYHLTESQKERLQEVLPRFFLHETEKQQLERIAKAARQLQKLNSKIETTEWESACEQLIMQLRGRRMYTISQMPQDRLRLYLAFESSTNTLLWKQQVDSVSAVLDARGRSVAYELLMSLGKTFFAIPMTALSYADGSKIVFLVWPEPMYATQTRETGEQLALLSGRPITPLQIDRKMPVTTEKLDALLTLMKNIRHAKGAISTRKRDLQALELLFIEYLKKLPLKLHATQISVVSKMQKLLATLRKRALFIGDEAHQIFQDMHLHFPLGLKEKMDRYEANATRNSVLEFLKGPLGEVLRTHTKLNDRKGSRELFEAESQRIARKMVEEKLLGIFDPKDHEEVISYLLNKENPTPNCLLSRPKKQKSVDAARGVLLYLFPLLFTRSIGGAFTRSKKYPHRTFVIPSAGNDNPCEQQEIVTPHEKLVKTLVHDWHHGLPLHHMNHLIRACQLQAKKWSEKHHQPLTEAPDAKAFAALFPPENPYTLEEALKDIDKPKALEVHFTPIIKSLDLLVLYSRLCVEPALECNPTQCSSSAYDYAAQAHLNIVDTGTAFNAAIYPLEMERQLNKSTLGEAVTHIKNKCPPNGVVSLISESAQEVLKEVVEKFFVSDIEATALIDGGGLLTGIPHEKVARFMLNEVRKKRPHIEVIDYFDIDPKTNETICWSLVHGASAPIPTHLCKVPLEKRLAYFDEAHGVAANILQPTGGKGVWLVGTGHPLSSGAQNAFRMRGLKKYIECLGLLKGEQEIQEAVKEIHKKDVTSTQTLYIALAPQVAHVLKKVDAKEPTVEQVFDYLAEQEEKTMETIHLNLGLSMLQGALRNHTMNGLLQAKNHEELLNHFRHSQSLFITVTPQGASKLYGGARGVVSGEALIRSRAQASIETLRNNPLLSDAQKQVGEEKINETLLHLLKLSLPKEIPVSVDEQGAYVLNIDGAGQEIEAEAEKETEREMEQQNQNQPENQEQPFKIKTDPWSVTCPLDSSKWQWCESLPKQTIITSAKQGVSDLLGKIQRKITSRESTHFSPPLFKLTALLNRASEKVLRNVSKSVDERIWWSNHLLPQTHLPLNKSPAEPASIHQRPITHLLVELESTVSEKVLSIGCLGPTDANYWMQRLQAEHHHNSQAQVSKKERLFVLYQMPLLENSQKKHYDGSIIIFNQKNNWNPERSEEFQRLEMMIKFCNGDIHYTEKQRTLLKQWKEASVCPQTPEVFDRAFSHFSAMSRARLGKKEGPLYALIDIIDPLHEE